MRTCKRLNELARRDDVYLDNRIAAIFAIADAHDARGETDIAFAAYEGAHRYVIERDALEKRSYNRAQDVARIQSIMELSRAVAGDRVAGERAAADLHRRHAALRHDADRRRVGCALARLRLRRAPGDASDPALADRRPNRWSRRRMSACCRTGRSSISATCREPARRRSHH